MRLISGVAAATLSLTLGLADPLSQVPLAGPPALQASPWRLNFSSTAPYLFSSVSSLLQQWGNTFFPNGHNIVPCEIPAYTLFYHGRTDAETPPSPEWLAFDIEMSYGIMGSTRDSHLLTYQTTKPVKALYFDGESATLMGLGQLDTQMLHVFGNVSGPPHDGWGLYEEYARAAGLCDWLEATGLRGDGRGYEGIIRMNAGFEMIWCNFTSPSLRLLTRLNVTAPQLGVKAEGAASNMAVFASEEEGEPESPYYPLPPLPTRTDRSADPTSPPMPPNWRRDSGHEPFLASQSWGWFSSATYHYGKSKNSPGLGEIRARITNCGIMSYYSPRFANAALLRAEDERDAYNLTAEGHWLGPGLDGNRTAALNDLRRRRRYHHLENVTAEEASFMRKGSEQVLRGLLDGENTCTGADWAYITNEITQSAGIHVNELSAILESFSQRSQNDTAIRSWMSSLRSHSHSFYLAFLEYPARYDDPAAWSTSSALYKDAHARCRFRYTRLMAPPADGPDISAEERDLRWAVEETYGAICSVLLTVGFQIEQSWAEDFQLAAAEPAATIQVTAIAGSLLGGRYARLASTWSSGVQELMAWLGWEDDFTGCSEVCAWDERCYIPMWPMFASSGGGFGGRRPPGGGRNGSYPNPYSPRGPGGGGKGGPGGGGPPRHGPGGPGGGDGGGERRQPRGGNNFMMGDGMGLYEPKCLKISEFTSS
ncbi:hypothetical protein BX600DRAFT_505941 [Xylariales sp. PMI_506]|nr:hypothetical protein BX600DRAFT_505941 [Xylariales sp. PMI_506]